MEKSSPSRLFWGLLCCLFIGLISLGLAPFLSLLGKTLLALLIGLLLHRWLHRETTKAGIQFSAKTLLKWAVMFMGIRLSFTELQEAGIEMGYMIFISVFPILLLGFFFSRREKEHSSLILFIAIGTAVCGSAAIAAAAPFIKHKQQDLGASIAIVNLLGLLGVFFLPFLASSFIQDSTQLGMWIGATLQAVGHVAAAGDVLGTEIADIAICTKMGRVFMLLPLVLFLGFQTQSQEKSFTQKITALWYLWGFFGFIFLHPIQQLTWISDLSSFTLVVAMAGIGLSINLKQALQNSKTAIGYGAGLWIVQIMICGLWTAI